MPVPVSPRSCFPNDSERVLDPRGHVARASPHRRRMRRSFPRTATTVASGVARCRGAVSAGSRGPRYGSAPDRWVSGSRQSSGGLTLNGTANVFTNSETFDISGSITMNAGNLTVTNNVSSPTAAVTVSGSVTTVGTAEFRVSNGTYAYTAGTFVLDGILRLTSLTADVTPAMTLDGTDQLILSNVTLNAPSVTSTSSVAQSWSTVTTAADISNSGTITFGGTSQLDGTYTSGVGSTLNVGPAQVVFLNSWTNNGLLDFTSSGATLEIQEGSLVNAAGSTINVAFAGNSLNMISLQNQGAMTFGGNLTVTGSLISSNASTATFTGSVNALLSVAGLNVDGATFDSVRLFSNEGTLTAFDNVTFQNMATTATQLSITNAGNASPYSFTNIDFLTVPTTGFYVQASETGGAPVLTINITSTTPGDGTAFENEVGGAVINWL